MPLTMNNPVDLEILKNAQILIVDNDRDTQDLYAFLLDSYAAKVTTISSIQGALDFLSKFTPTILICEIRFLGESVYPLLQQIKQIKEDCNRMIPILAVSTCSAMSLADDLRLQIEAYQIKPIDLDQFFDTVWSLVLLSKITQPFAFQDYLANLPQAKHSLNGIKLMA